MGGKIRSVRRIRGWRFARSLACLGLALGVAPMAASGDPAPKLVVTVPAEGAFVGAKFAVKGTLTGAPTGAIVKLGELSATVANDGAFEFAVTADRDGVRKMRVVYAAVGAAELASLRNVTVDTTPPKFEELRPEGASGVIDGPEAKIAGRVVDVAPVELLINGVAASVRDDGKFEVPIALPAEGSVTVTIVARDLAGNSAAPIVKSLSRWADPSPPRINFERARENGENKDVRVVWIASDYARTVLDENAVAHAKAIREREGKVPNFATAIRPFVVLVRSADPVPSAKFELGMKVLRAIGGAVHVTGPPPAAGTGGGDVDVVDLSPDPARDGSWHVRLDAKDWVLSAADAKLLSLSSAVALPPATRAAIEALGVQLKEARRQSTVRFRLTEPVPVRLFEEVRLAGCAGAKVIVDCSGSSVVAATTGPAKPKRPPPTRFAFPSRLERRAPGNRGSADAAVEHALAWLAAHQSSDGGWECKKWVNWCDRKESPGGEALEGAGDAAFDVGVTGLALLAFLGAGYTDRAEGPYGKVVADGLARLRSLQDRDGCFGERSTGHYVYDHAIAAAAMIEAYGMTRNETFRVSAQRGLDFVAILRNPYFAWRYGVKPGDNDTSVTAWMTLALYSAKLCNLAEERAGEPGTLTYDAEALDGIRAWIDKMTDPDTGRVGYQQRGNGPSRPDGWVDRFPFDKSESMTAVGMLCRIALGESPKTSDVIKKGAELCLRLVPTWNKQDGSIDLYYWYFATQALFQLGGEPWKKWEAAMKTGILDEQRLDTTNCKYKGSWDPIDAWGHLGGRVYSTALMALACEVRYRYR